jgi:hypothetical protein
MGLEKWASRLPRAFPFGLASACRKKSGMKAARAGALLIYQRKLLTYHFQSDRQQYWRIPAAASSRMKRRSRRPGANCKRSWAWIKSSDCLARIFDPAKAHGISSRMLMQTNCRQKIPKLPRSLCHPMDPLEKLADYDIRPPGLKWEMVEFFKT